jgi:hypothetical protein
MPVPSTLIGHLRPTSESFGVAGFYNKKIATFANASHRHREKPSRDNVMNGAPECLSPLTLVLRS